MKAKHHNNAGNRRIHLVPGDASDAELSKLADAIIADGAVQGRKGSVKMKGKGKAEELRMSSAAFDDTMRRAFQAGPLTPKMGKGGRRKKGGKKA